MNNSNPLYQETMAQRHAEDLLREAASPFSEFDAPEPRPEWFAHQLTHLADWMIRTGEHLHQRYDHDEMHTGHAHIAAH